MVPINLSSYALTAIDSVPEEWAEATRDMLTPLAWETFGLGDVRSVGMRMIEMVVELVALGVVVLSLYATGSRVWAVVRIDVWVVTIFGVAPCLNGVGVDEFVVADAKILSVTVTSSGCTPVLVSSEELLVCVNEACTCWPMTTRDRRA